LINKIVHNLNILLTDRNSSKDDIKKLRKETILLYKKFIIEYNNLPKKNIKKESINDKIKRINKLKKSIEIKTVNVHSVKLKKDEWLKYFSAMLEKGDTVKILKRDFSN
jgi:hypothetical protein